MKGLFTKIWAEHKKITRRRGEPPGLGWKVQEPEAKEREGCVHRIPWWSQIFNGEPACNKPAGHREGKCPRPLSPIPQPSTRSPHWPSLEAIGQETLLMPSLQVSPQGESWEGAWRAAKGGKKKTATIVFYLLGRPRSSCTCPLATANTQLPKSTFSSGPTA